DLVAGEQRLNVLKGRGRAQHGVDGPQRGRPDSPTVHSVRDGRLRHVGAAGQLGARKATYMHGMAQRASVDSDAVWRCRSANGAGVHSDGLCAPVRSGPSTAPGDSSLRSRLSQPGTGRISFSAARIARSFAGWIRRPFNACETVAGETFAFR